MSELSLKKKIKLLLSFFPTMNYFQVGVGTNPLALFPLLNIY